MAIRKSVLLFVVLGQLGAFGIIGLVVYHTHTAKSHAKKTVAQQQDEASRASASATFTH